MVEEQITLREVFPEDLGFLAHLYGDTRREEIDAWGWPDEQQQWFLKMQFDARSSCYRTQFPKAADRIVEMQKTPIGRMLVDEEQGGLRLIDIALLSEHRNRGIGSFLLRNLMQQCGKRGQALRLQVLQGSPALQLYLRLGFQQTSTDEIYAQMEWLCTAPMERLSAPEKLCIQDFAPYLHRHFHVVQPEGYELELVEVNDLSKGSQDQFSVIFVSPVSPWLQQGIYTLHHPRAFEMTLFLVPIGPNAQGMRYEAVFSHLPGA